MSNALDKIIAVIIALLIMFIAPASYFQMKKDSVIQVNVDKETAEFVERVSIQGYLTRAMYEKYLKSLSITGKLYSVELEHEQNAFEPEYKFRTAGEVMMEDESAWAGSNEYYAEPVNTTIPVVTDPVDNSGLGMNTETNASVLASAVSTPALAGHIHTDTCYIGHRHSTSGCTLINRYYTGSAVGLTCTQNNGSNSGGSIWNYRNLYCASCTKYIGYATYAQSTNDAILNWNYSWIETTQYYLDSDNTIRSLKGPRTARYLVSPTDPGGWTYVSTTVYWGGVPQTISEYRAPNPAWINAYNMFGYIAADMWGGVNRGALNSLGYKDAYSCPFCLQEGRLSKTLVENYSCGQVQDNTSDCNQQITSITPTHPNQKVYRNEPLLTTVIVTYADGSTRTVAGTTTYSTANIAQNQIATITYSTMVGGVTTMKSCTITVTVVPKTHTCVYGHIYNLNSDGSDSGCPFCKNWLQSLSVYAPSGGNLTMYRNVGGSLEIEGVGLLAVYLDGHSEFVYSGYLDNLDPDYVGTQQVTIGYKGLTTILQVQVKRNQTQCGVCGLTYDLHMDDSDTGCPYCKAKVPVFTGNVLKYCRATYRDEMITQLYEGSGTYYLRRGDHFKVKVVSRNRTEFVTMFSRMFGLSIRVNKIDTIKDESIQ